MLTTGVDMGDAFEGTEKGDVFNAFDVVNPSTLTKLSTLNSFDTLDGKEGNDILNIQTGIAIPPATILNLTSIETVNVKSAVPLTLNGSNWEGTNTLNVTQATTSADLIAAATTDVNVSGVTGTVDVDGGKNVNVTVAATGTATTIGATTGAAGTVTVTDAAQNGAIAVDGGTDVTITASGNNALTDTIDVGQAPLPASPLPTGAVTVSSTGVYADANVTMGTIKINGGSTVTVTQSAGITDAQKTAALTDGTNFTVTQGAITIKGDGNTTTVNVKQDATVAAVAIGAAAVAGSTQTQTVTFNALAAGNTVTVNNLTFTAARDLTAAEVAAAFANLEANDTQSNTGITTNGSYTGSNNATAFTTGAVVGNTVVYSEVTNGTNALVLVPIAAKGLTGVTTPTDPTAVITTIGAPTTGAIDGKIGVAAAVVTVTDDAVAATDKIKTVTVDGFKTASSVTSDALTDLTLKNGDVNAVFTVNNAVASSSLTLNVDNITGAGASEIDLAGNTITNLTINATGKDSKFILDADGLVDLTINATAGLDISNTAAYATAALKTVDVNGAGKVNLGDLTGSSLNTFDASGNAGGVTAEINTTTVGTITEYVFSAGNDVVTLAENTVDTKITLGAGDDIVTLDSGTTGLAAVIDGGTGIDTLEMFVADANGVTDGTFEAKISGFEKLSLTATLAAAVIDLSLFDDIDYVISAGTGNGFKLDLTNMANNGTLELTGDTSAGDDITVTVANASGNTDKFNIVTKVDAADIDFDGAVKVANVEIININAIDSSTDISIEEASLIVTANLAKTVNVTGSSKVDLDLAGSTLVTLIDATNLTGALTATTDVSTSAATIKGGSGDDVLTATTKDKLYGNVGADTLIVADDANLVQLYGGTGIDTYIIGIATNSNGYATINGTKAELSGDIIKFGAPLAITPIDLSNSLAKIDNLGSTADFQDYANEAAKGSASAGSEITSWFQFEGNTYVIQDSSPGDSFVNGADAVVKITGLVDLTFNVNGTLEIA